MFSVDLSRRCLEYFCPGFKDERFSFRPPGVEAPCVLHLLPPHQRLSDIYGPLTRALSLKLT